MFSFFDKSKRKITRNQTPLHPYRPKGKKFLNDKKHVWDIAEKKEQVVVRTNTNTIGRIAIARGRKEKSIYLQRCFLLLRRYSTYSGLSKRSPGIRSKYRSTNEVSRTDWDHIRRLVQFQMYILNTIFMQNNYKLSNSKTMINTTYNYIFITMSLSLLITSTSKRSR